tara:strand:- start:5782 stop:6981 length:1200 start_codon:yes stop_codon:yes gene_type:complete
MPRRRDSKAQRLGDGSGGITALRERPSEIVDIFVDELCTLINAGQEQSLHSMYRRNLLVSFLNSLPVLNRVLCASVRTDDRYAACMYYERTRLRAGASGHFLEALPRGLSLFGFHEDGGSSEMSLETSLVRIAGQRTVLIENIEARKREGADVVNCFDLSAGIPWRVKHFVAAQRSYAARLRIAKPKHFFTSCPHLECRRMVYCGPIRAIHEDETPPYWCALDNKSSHIGAPAAKFCSWLCRKSHDRDVQTLKECVDLRELDADVGCRKEGRLRCAEALRRCVARNETIGRSVRLLESTLHTPAIDPAEFFAGLKRRLNIDLGLLYTAAIIAESRSLSAGKVLPGAYEGWRGRPVFYMRAIRLVSDMYDKHHRGGNVVSNLHVGEPFLRKLRERALQVF